MLASRIGGGVRPAPIQSARVVRMVRVHARGIGARSIARASVRLRAGRAPSLTRPSFSRPHINININTQAPVAPQPARLVARAAAVDAPAAEAVAGVKEGAAHLNFQRGSVFKVRTTRD